MSVQRRKKFEHRLVHIIKLNDINFFSVAIFGDFAGVAVHLNVRALSPKKDSSHSRCVPTNGFELLTHN